MEVRNVVAKGFFQRVLSQFTVNSANGKINNGSFILIVASPSLKSSVQNRPKTVQMNKAVRAVKIVLLGLCSSLLTVAITKLRAIKTAPALVPNCENGSEAKVMNNPETSILLCRPN